MALRRAALRSLNSLPRFQARTFAAGTGGDFSNNYKSFQSASTGNVHGQGKLFERQPAGSSALGVGDANTARPGEDGFDYSNWWGKKGAFRDAVYFKECFIPRDCVQERTYIIAATHPRARQDIIINDETLIEGAEGLGLDSLDQVEFCLALEHEFKIEIPDWEAERILTIGDAVDLVADHPHAM